MTLTTFPFETRFAALRALACKSALRPLVLMTRPPATRLVLCEDLPLGEQRKERLSDRVSGETIKQQGPQTDPRNRICSALTEEENTNV